MDEKDWAAATFAGASVAQADAVAALTATERVALLEQLLELAVASGALRRSREAKQRGLDALWAAG